MIIDIGRLYIHRKFVFMYIIASLAYIIATALRNLIDLVWTVFKLLLRLAVSFAIGIVFYGSFTNRLDPPSWLIALMFTVFVVYLMLAYWALDYYCKEQTPDMKRFTRHFKKKKYRRECWQVWHEYYLRRYQKLLTCKSLVKVQ